MEVHMVKARTRTSHHLLDMRASFSLFFYQKTSKSTPFTTKTHGACDAGLGPCIFNIFVFQPPKTCLCNKTF